jgi:hypothetical protein
MINPEKKHKKFIKISVEAFICRFVNMHIDTHTKTGGNRNTRRKPQTCCKSLTNFIT